ALFGVVDEGLQKACGRDIIMLVADVVRFAHRRNDALIVVAQFRQHVLRLDVGGIVIGQPLLARNIADRAQSWLSDFADTLGENVGRGKDLLGLLVEQQVVVAEMWSTDVPVEILGLEIKDVGVGQDAVEGSGDVFGGIGA